MNDQTQPIEQLIACGQSLVYVFETLQTSQIPGHDASKHVAALALVEGQLQSIDSDIKSHPDFAAHVEAQKAKEAAKQAKLAEIRKASLEAEAAKGNAPVQFGG